VSTYEKSIGNKNSKKTTQDVTVIKSAFSFREIEDNIFNNINPFKRKNLDFMINAISKNIYCITKADNSLFRNINFYKKAIETDERILSLFSKSWNLGSLSVEECLATIEEKIKNSMKNSIELVPFDTQSTPESRAHTHVGTIQSTNSGVTLTRHTEPQSNIDPEGFDTLFLEKEEIPNINDLVFDSSTQNPN
jgi:hypothetical protein